MTQRSENRARADVLVWTRGLAPSRSRAQELIRQGRVTAEGKRVDRPGELVREGAELTVLAGQDFVSRGGRKLDGALDLLGVDMANWVVADIGASTGGFTECALARGARRVYAVDVGKDQLAKSLGSDPRVVVKDSTNARTLERKDFDEDLDLVLVDASFIGIGKLLPALSRILPPGSHLVALVKPQFEVGPAAARRSRGVVRDPELRARAIDAARVAIVSAGFDVAGECDSPVPGAKGNVERFVHAVRR